MHTHTHTHTHTQTHTYTYTHTYTHTRTHKYKCIKTNSREKWRKCISVTGNFRGQAQVQPIDKLDETFTNADDQMILVKHHSGDRVMSWRGFGRIS